MNRIFYKYIALLTLLCAIPESYANSPFGPVKVVSVGVSDFGFFFVNVSNSSSSKHSEACDEGKENSFAINTSSPYEKEIYATALTALVTGKSISGWANGCHTFGASWKTPKLTLIKLHGDD